MRSLQLQTRRSPAGNASPEGFGSKISHSIRFFVVAAASVVVLRKHIPHPLILTSVYEDHMHVI
jgi:hypothetical protein